MQNDYVDIYERYSVEYINRVNSNLHWFSKIERQPNEAPIDFLCIDVKGRDVALEVKIRHCYINTYEEIYLNPEKYEALMQRQREGYIPLYLNFLQDYKHFILWDLSVVKPSEGKVCQHLTNVARNDYDETRVKYGLPVRKGAYFEYNESTGKFERRW